MLAEGERQSTWPKNLLSDVPSDSGHPLEAVKPHRWGHGDEIPSSKMLDWLVVSTPLKNISQWEGLSHTLWKIKNVPNHQSVEDYMFIPIMKNA